MRLGKGFIMPTREAPIAAHPRIGAKLRPTSIVVASPIIRNQRATESCTGFGAMQGEHLCFARDGIEHELASPFFPYFFGRRERAKSDEAVIDVGADPYDIVDATDAFGMCRWSDWEPTDERVNMRPPTVAIVSAQRHRLKLNVIPETGSARVERIYDALAGRMPVMIAKPVDTAYEQLDGPTVIGPITGESLGGHMTCLFGYEPRGFDEAGSWDVTWRNGGTSILTPDCIAQSVVWCATVEIER